MTEKAPGGAASSSSATWSLRVPAYGAARGQHVAAADAEVGERRPGDECLAEPAVQGGRELEAGLGGVLPGDVVDRRLGRYDEVEGARGAVHGQRDGAVGQPPAALHPHHHHRHPLTEPDQPTPIRGPSGE